VAHEWLLHDAQPLALLEVPAPPPSPAREEKNIERPRLAWNPPQSGHAIGASASLIARRA
jgi:hypothetical protein